MVNILSAFEIAINTVLVPNNILLIFLATMFGLLMGIVPGLGGTTGLALLIPLTYDLDPLAAFMVLAAAKGGTNYGGSITSILLNTPGTAANAATLLDGYPLTRQGRSSEALGASAAASATGALVGTGILLLSIPVMVEIALLFGSPELLLLGIWGLAVVSVVIRGNMTVGLISGVLGIILITHGQSGVTGSFRWTYGLTFMRDGFKLVPSLIGLFAIAEMINLVSKGESIEQEANIERRGGKLKGVKEVLAHKVLFFRSALTGSLLGLIPGVGGVTANYVAYFQAMEASQQRDKFGTGYIGGIIASEASNDAKDGSAFVPTLAFGIPGSASMAILLGAFTLHGLTPGPLLIQNNLEIVAIIIIALVISNVLTSTVGLLVAERLSLITKLDVRWIAPPLIVIVFIASFTINSNIYDLFLTFIFGLLGYWMIRLDISRVPLILGMVLGPIVEENLIRTLVISRGDVTAVFTSPLSQFLIVLIVVSLVWPFVGGKIKSRVISS